MSFTSSEPANNYGQTPSSRKLEGNISALPIGRGNLKPTRGSSSLRGRRDSGRHSSQVSVPAQTSGLRYSSTADFDSGFAVIIDYKVPLVTTATHPPGRPRKDLQKDIQDADQLPSLSPRRVRRLPKIAPDSTEALTIPTKRKMGRPRIHQLPESKRKQATVDPKSVVPKFIPFLCEWKDCKAELHNLEILRRHIFTVHNKPQPSGRILCHWANCGSTDIVRDKITLAKSMIYKPYKFKSIDSWKDHTERKHLVPIAWHMGDGPRGSTIDGDESDRSAYLSDDSGLKVALSIDGRVVESKSAYDGTSN